MTTIWSKKLIEMKNFEINRETQVGPTPKSNYW